MSQPNPHLAAALREIQEQKKAKVKKPVPETATVPYAKQKKADLQAEVARRNRDREDGLIEVDGKGTVADLVAALEADDATTEGDPVPDPESGETTAVDEPTADPDGTASGTDSTEEN